VVKAPDEFGRRAVTIHTQDDADGPWTRHATGVLSADEPAPVVGVDWLPANATPLDVEGLYDRLAAAGLDYGPAFQGLRAAWRHGNDLYAEVALPEGTDVDGYPVHPALLDAALHSLALTREGGDVELPFAWSGVRFHATGAAVLRVRLQGLDRRTVSLTATDDTGAPVVTVRGLTTRPGGTGHRDALYRLEWPSAPLSEVPPSLDGWAVLGADPLGLAARFELPAHADPAAFSDGTPEVVLFPCERSSVHEVLATLQRWLADDRLLDSKLVLVSRNAVATRAAEDVPDPAAASIWGLVRVAQSENPDRFTLIDVDGTSSGAVPAAVASGEPQLALRDGIARVPRLAPAGPGDVLSPPAGAAGWRLEVTRKGSLDDVALVAHDIAPLEPGQVRVAVRAAGLNFRDVLITLGMYPDENALLGSEGAGVVLEVGPDVTGFAPGDRVMGLLSGGLGPVAVTDHRVLVPMPQGWSYAQAATVPIVFLTAYYSLVRLADTRPGESLLIHAATGGVGMAATQLARHLGLEVFATASPAKWPVLRSLGYDDTRVASSRTLDFEQRFLAATDGSGVDVVLNSLAGEFVDASLRLLPRGGRFLEMGKTDVRDPDRVARDHPGVAYRAFDMAAEAPEVIQEMLTELVALFERGVLHPLPVTAWDVRRAPEALRYLSQARHTGKLVLTLPSRLDPDGTVLVTGGTGALGRLVARHLVEAHGVRHLLLAGRRGPDGAEDLRAALTALGAHVDIRSCDVSDRQALSGLLAGVPAEHPLTAVVHTAGVLADATIPALTDTDLDTVAGPKAEGAWHLHELTAGLNLDAFVLFSSIAGVVGAPGQGNYAAANASLDALAAHRAARGLPATSLAWGPWASSEGMAGQEGVKVGRGGAVPLSAERGLALLDAALDRPDA
ncbi:SDR family NAD(P)-dependent oxidoreductase, partial [Actinosynnema sp. NPDC023658]|uniref:SDR family NAD(P)-dependent oxidoreductase n=1 Tax=Actinosynnema sp. NPDC023658 TaxID=3155465 RepID=UPI0033C57BDB